MSSTVRDVAERAQVSAATVSLVLNGKGGISEETRARVLMAAAELHYESRTPRTAQAVEVAAHGHAALPEDRQARPHREPRPQHLHLRLHRRHVASGAACGYKLEVVSHEGRALEDIVASLSGAALSGVVVLGTELTEDDVKAFDAAEVPFVVIDTFHDRLESNFVNMNNKDAVYRSLGHAVERGFRSIGFIASDVRTINFQLRREAFLEGVRHFGLKLDPRHVVTVDSTYDGAYQDMLAQLRAGLVVPDCYVCTNDIIAYGCIKALRERDIRIPKDLSIIGFDNLPMSATMDPPLTTIDVSKRKIGSLAITLLAEQIRSQVAEPAVKILVGADLVVRDSVAPRALARRSKASVDVA